MSAKLEKVEFYQDRKGQWRWRFRAINGKILADSAEGYRRIGMAKKAFAVVRPSNITEARPPYLVRELAVTIRRKKVTRG